MSYFRLAPLRLILALAVQLCGLAVVLAWWALRSIPAALPDVPASAAMLPCVSYAPFRLPHINPFNPAASVTPEQIDTDLRLLKTRTNCIRTYGLTQGLDAVPAVARALGMRVKLGVWLTRDDSPTQTHNRAQIDRGLQLAEQFRDVVDLLVVGNEVLLRRELTQAQLGQQLRYAKARSPVPVTYADVWEFWQRNAALAQHVDVVTVHVLPYWEDKPVAVNLAVAHVRAIAAQMQREFAPKPVWVGETGWPAAGRQRAGAVPGVVEQTRFVRELLLSAQQAPFGYNLIEAFDQPWKRSFEGAMGGYWGLFDQFGQARVTLSGPVAADRLRWLGCLGALVGGLIVLLGRKVQRVFAEGARPDFSGWWITACAGATLGALLPMQWLMMVQWDRTPRELMLSGMLMVVGWLATFAALRRDERSGNATPSPPGEGGGEGQRRRKHWQRFITLNFFVSASRISILFSAATAALVLLLDPRYRPFPWWWFLSPAITWSAVAMLRRTSQRSITLTEERLLAGILMACAIANVIHEGIANAQALGYSAVLLLLAAALGWPEAFAGRANTSTASKAAGADSSVV